MTYGKMTSMNMNRTATAASVGACSACASSAANTVIMILDAIIMASIFVVRINLIAVISLLGLILVSGKIYCLKDTHTVFA